MLGFYPTDWFDDIVTFLTCNYDHHVVNPISGPVTKLHHLAFELRGCAHQYEASDRLTKANVPIQWGPSRHIRRTRLRLLSPRSQSHADRTL